MTKVIALNGPPYCGKDVVADVLARQLQVNYGGQPIRFQTSSMMRRMAYAMLGLEYSDEDYAIRKDQVQSLTGETLRQTIIRLSEEHVRPKYGADFWMRSGTHRLPPTTNFLVISGIGFATDVEYFEKAFGADNFLLVSMTREGCDWGQDSRSGVGATNRMLLANDDTIHSAAKQIRFHCQAALDWNLLSRISR